MPLLSAADRLELARLAAPGARDEVLQLRARIVLSWAAGATGKQSAALLGTSRRTVSKWRTRFREQGLDGLIDAPRPGAPRTIDAGKIAALLRLLDSPPPPGKRRWSTRLLAEHAGLSQSTVVRLLRGFD